MRHVVAIGVLAAAVATLSGQSGAVSVTYPAKAGPGKGGTSCCSPATRSIAARKGCRCSPRS